MTELTYLVLVCTKVFIVETNSRGSLERIQGKIIQYLGNVGFEFPRKGKQLFFSTAVFRKH